VSNDSPAAASAAPDALGQAVIDALVFRMCNDKDRTVAAVDVIFDHGDGGIYSAMCAWAEAIKMRGLTDDQPGPWVLEVDGPAGESVDTAPRGAVFAARFLTAWANGDRDMTRDMFFALRPVEDAELCADALINLLDMASATMKGTTSE
jgi:hypothetical protein